MGNCEKLNVRKIVQASASAPDKREDETIRAMRVNDPNTNLAGVNPGAGSAAGAGATGKTAQLDPIKITSSSGQGVKGADRDDSVQLSGLSSKINQLQAGTAERDSYIEGLRQEVSAGTYEADPNAIASTIVDNLLTKNG